MIYELRSYWINPDLMEEYMVWANEKALPLFRREGFRIIGFWRVDGEAGTPDPAGFNVVWMLQWDSREQRDREWQRVRSGPDLAKIREGIPAYHLREGNFRFLRPTPASPLQ